MHWNSTDEHSCGDEVIGFGLIVVWTDDFSSNCDVGANNKFWNEKLIKWIEKLRSYIPNI